MSIVSGSSFEELAEQIHKDREAEELRKTLENIITGKNVYGCFCVWCNAFNKGEGKTDPSVFKKFLNEQNIELTFWQKKHLSEDYFGYEYFWDNKAERWLIKKKSV